MVLCHTQGEWRARAYSTTCEIDVSASSYQVTNPTSARYPKTKTKHITWVVTCNNLLSDKSDDLYNYLKSGEEIDLLFTTIAPSGLMQTDPPLYQHDERYYLTGKVVVTRYRVVAQHRDYARSTVTLTGSGELTRYINGSSSSGTADYRIIKDADILKVTDENNNEVPSAYSVKRIKEIINIDALPYFSAEQDYSAGDIIQFDGKAYIFDNEHPKAGWDPSDVRPLTLETMATPVGIPVEYIDQLISQHNEQQ